MPTEIQRATASIGSNVQIAEVEPASKNDAKNTVARRAKQQRGRPVEAREAPRRTRKERTRKERELASSSALQDAPKELKDLIGEIALQSDIRDVNTLDASVKKHADDLQKAGEANKKFEQALQDLATRQAEGKTMTEDLAKRQAEAAKRLNWEPGAKKTEVQETTKRGLFAVLFGRKKEEKPELTVENKTTTAQSVMNEGNEMTLEIFADAKIARDLLKERTEILSGAIRYTSGERRKAVFDKNQLRTKLNLLEAHMNTLRAEQAEIEKVEGKDKDGTELALENPRHAELADLLVHADHMMLRIGEDMMFFSQAIKKYDRFATLANQMHEMYHGFLKETDHLLTSTAIESRMQDQLALTAGAAASLAQISANLRASIVHNREMAEKVLAFVADAHAANQAAAEGMEIALTGYHDRMYDKVSNANKAVENVTRAFVKRELESENVTRDVVDELPVDARPDDKNALTANNLKMVAALASLVEGKDAIDPGPAGLKI